MGKGRDAKAIYEAVYFPSCDAHHVVRLLGRLRLPFDVRASLEQLEAAPLSLEAVADDAAVLLSAYVVGGRFRLLCGIIEVVGKLLDGDAAHPAGDLATMGYATGARRLLRAAVRHCVERHTDGMLTLFKMRLDLKSPAYLKDATPLLKYLHEIYVTTVLLGGKTAFQDNRAPYSAVRDLTSLGVAVAARAYEPLAGADPVTEYVVREHFVLEAISRFFADEQVQGKAIAGAFRESVRRLREVLAVFGPTAQFKGNVVERAILQRLVVWGQGPAPQFVPDLPFFPAVPADSPWRHVRFFPIGVQSTADHPDVSAFMSSAGARNVVISPDARCRPDGVVMLEPLEDGVLRAVVVGVALYAEDVPSAKVASQFTSTDPSRAYTDGQGRAYASALSRRKAWVEAGLHKTVAVRVHVSLPKSSSTPLTSQTYVRETTVDGKDWSGSPTQPGSSRGGNASSWTLAPSRGSATSSSTWTKPTCTSCWVAPTNPRTCATSTSCSKWPQGLLMGGPFD